MKKNEQMPLKLKTLRERSGLTIREIGDALGYSHGTGYQRYEDPTRFKKKYLPLDKAELIADELVGKGDPPVRRIEVLQLAGIDHLPRSKAVKVVPAFEVPVVGEAQAGHFVSKGDIRAGAEQTIPVAEDTRYPNNIPRFALRIRGESMNQVFVDGSYAVCISVRELGAPLVSDNYVVLERRRAGMIETTIKRLQIREDNSKWLLPLGAGPELNEPVRVDGREISITAIVTISTNPL